MYDPVGHIFAKGEMLPEMMPVGQSVSVVGGAAVRQIFSVAAQKMFTEIIHVNTLSRLPLI